MNTITICGQTHQLIGSLDHGRRIVTDCGDYMLRPLFRADYGVFNLITEREIIPADQELTKIHSMDFFPWKRDEESQITDADMPEIKRRTKLTIEATLKQLEARESEINSSTAESPKAKQDKLEAIAHLRKPLLKGSYNESNWIQEYGDAFRKEKWNRKHKPFRIRTRFRFKILQALGLRTDDYGFRECAKFIDRIRYEVIYPHAAVYLEALDRISPNMESLQLRQLAMANANQAEVEKLEVRRPIRRRRRGRPGASKASLRRDKQIYESRQPAAGGIDRGYGKPTYEETGKEFGIPPREAELAYNRHRMRLLRGPKAKRSAPRPSPAAQGKHCRCGRPAVKFEARDWVCAHCQELQRQRDESQ